MVLALTPNLSDSVACGLGHELDLSSPQLL